MTYGFRLFALLMQKNNLAITFETKYGTNFRGNYASCIDYFMIICQRNLVRI